MEFKGTSGEWNIDSYDRIVDDFGSLIADCDHPNRGYEEQKANAKLIAAAPELLEVLIEVVRISDRNNIVWNRAKEVIKKATQ